LLCVNELAVTALFPVNAPATLIVGALLMPAEFRSLRVYWNRVSFMVRAFTTHVPVNWADLLSVSLLVPCVGKLNCPTPLLSDVSRVHVNRPCSVKFGFNW
jgi:hypothetical protein